jgi:hypothetical protein
MHYADSLGLQEVVAEMRVLAATGGAEYWAPSPLLLELAAARSSFAARDAAQAR